MSGRLTLSRARRWHLLAVLVSACAATPTSGTGGGARELSEVSTDEAPEPADVFIAAPESVVSAPELPYPSDLGDSAAPDGVLLAAELPLLGSDVGGVADVEVVVPTPFETMAASCHFLMDPEPGQTDALASAATPLGTQQAPALSVYSCCGSHGYYLKGPFDAAYAFAEYTAYGVAGPLSQQCPNQTTKRRANVPLRFDCTDEGKKVTNVVRVMYFDPDSDAFAAADFEVTTRWNLPPRCHDASDWDATCCPTPAPP